MMTYKEAEQRKAEGKLWLDSAGGMAKAQIGKILTRKLNKTFPLNIPKRMLLAKLLFGSFGVSWVEPPLNVCVGKNIHIGSGCYFNVGTTFIDDYTITIEDHVMFGPNVTVITTGHPVHPDLRANGEMYCAPVTIKQQGVWVGANVTILPGVTIGENSVIGAGSVVTKDIPANVIAMGTPCKVVREIDDHDREYYYKDRHIDFGKID